MYPKVQGMTLLEVLVALMLTVIIGIGLSQIAFFSTKNYQYNQITSQVSAQANFIKTKLERAIRHGVPNEFHISQGSDYYCLEVTPILFRGVINLYKTTKTINVSKNTSSFLGLHTKAMSLEKHLIIPSKNHGDFSQKSKILAMKSGQVTLNEPITVDTETENQICYIALNPVSYCIIDSNNSPNGDYLVQCPQKSTNNFKECPILGTHIVDSNGESFFKGQSKPFANITRQDYQSNQVRFDFGLHYEALGVLSIHHLHSQITINND